jgi:hypothetical protein
LVSKIVDYLLTQNVHTQQAFVKKNITLKDKKVVELYGYVDYMTPNTIIDLKTTANYSFPKYLNNWQLLVYAYCLQGQIDAVEFVATDFVHRYIETYKEQEIQMHMYRLESVLELFIGWLENNKHRITDKKIFGGENEPVERIYPEITINEVSLNERVSNG